VISLLGPETRPGTVLLIRQDGTVQDPYASHKGDPLMRQKGVDSRSHRSSSTFTVDLLQRQAMAAWANENRPASFKKASDRCAFVEVVYTLNLIYMFSSKLMGIPLLAFFFLSRHHELAIWLVFYRSK